MENKENKIKAVKLSDDELENVSGGALHTLDRADYCEGLVCSVCGAPYSSDYLINGITVTYCETCRKEKLGW